MGNLIDHSVTPTARDSEVAAEALAGTLGALSGGGFHAVDAISRVIASVRVHAFNEAKRLAMEECDKYIDRMKAAAASSCSVSFQLEYRDRVVGATSCKNWIETIKEPA